MLRSEILNRPEGLDGTGRLAAFAMRRLELKLPPVAVFLVAGALMWLAARAGPALRIRLPALHWAAGVAALVGIAMGALAVISFRRAGTTISPTKPTSTSALVVSGIYRWTRNPMYLGLLFFLIGWALILANPLSLLGLLVFAAYMTRFQIIPEEKALASLFGSEFAAYQSRVRRWL